MEQPSVLIVDDESDHRLLLAAALQEGHQPHRVTLAGDVDEALEAAHLHDFDAVLCGYRLGPSDGFGLMRALRERGLDPPVLLVTDHGSEDVARRAFLEGAVDYLTKDAALRNPADLQRRLRRAVERRRLQREKQKAEAILESFLENNPYAILIFTPDGQVVRWNRALSRMESHPEDLASLRETYNPLRDPQLAEAGVTPLLRRALAGQWVEIPPFPWDPGRAGLRGPPRYLGGVAFPIEVQGERAPHLCAMIQDVTEAESARRERDEYAAILARLFDATEAALVFVAPNRAVRYANRRLTELFGVATEGVVGRPLEEVAEMLSSSTADPPAHCRRLCALCEDLESEGEETVDLAVPRSRHLRRRVSTVRDGAGRPLGRILAYFDETEAVEKRRLLEAQNRELDAFASRLAHDLKTPLVSLKGFVDLLYRQYGQALDDRGLLFLDKVRSSAAILGEMVDGLRELAHASEDASGCCALDPLPVLRLAVDGLAAEAAERGVEILLPSAMQRLECDRAKFYQIVQNLVTNALRHCDPEKPSRWARVEGRAVGGEVAVAVSDNGVGIAPEEMPDLFRPFRRGRQAGGRPGMGLGLAIVQRLAQVCGGRVEAESRLGEGSTFTVYLPRADRREEA